MEEFMNIKDRMILEDFRQYKENYIKLEEIAAEMLKGIAKDCGIKPALIEHRVKDEKSLQGKLYKNSDWYQKLDDLTDLLGERVICYFADEVDIIGKRVEEVFKVDREKSSDKRKLIAANAFGYLSLHYIVNLPDDSGYPEELCKISFEIQIRTILQHAWAAIDHDIAYKSKFGVPRKITRSFSRLAGLLEIADDEFVRTRDAMNEYTTDTHEKIMNNTADDVEINMVSLYEFVKYNRKMVEFLDELAELCSAEIMEVDPESYLPLLSWLGKTKIGDLQEMLENNRDLAKKLIENSLAATDLDIISSNVGLRCLCSAELLLKNYSEEKIIEFLQLSSRDRSRAEKGAKRILGIYEKLKEGTDD